MVKSKYYILLGCLSKKKIRKWSLKHRFGKPQLLISNHMEALLKSRIVSSVHGTKKLCDKPDNNEINIQSL